MIASLLLAVTTGLRLHSGDFTDGGAISTQLMATACGGANRTPSLDWSGAPAGTKSFALIVRDPDAPVAGGFDHWVLYDIPATTMQLSGNASIALGEVGLSSNGKAAYFGPCPPGGARHHYIFTLYALDERSVGATSPFTAAQLETAMSGHILATATLKATAASQQ